MIRLFAGALLLLCCSVASADTLLSNMEVCRLLTPSQCTFVPLSSMPTITQKDAVQELGQYFFIFGNDQTYSPPNGQTWTLAVSLSWDDSTVSRDIYQTGDGSTVFGVGFDIGIPDTTQFPDPPARTLFTLQTTMTDQNANVIDTATNYFYLERDDSIPEPSALVLLSSGVVGCLLYLRRRRTS